MNPFHTIPNEIAMFEDGEIPFEEFDDPFTGPFDHVLDAMCRPMERLRLGLRQVELGGNAYLGILFIDATAALAAWDDLAGCGP